MERMMGSIVRQAVEGGGDEINSISCDINMMVANWGEMHPQKVVGFQPLPHTWPPEYDIFYILCFLSYFMIWFARADYIFQKIDTFQKRLSLNDKRHKISCCQFSCSSKS